MYMQPLAVRLEQRRPPVVVDPQLALAPLGLPLTRALSRAMEVWLVPELWQILDNSCRWREAPECLLPDRPGELTAQALDAWEHWRADTDAAGLGCYYVGHRGSESLLPEGGDPNLPIRWQALATAFERRADGCPLDQPLAASWRDTAALSAALWAPILTLAAGSRRPAIAAALQSWCILDAADAPDDALLACESAYLRQLLVAAGAAKLIWGGLELAVLHLVVPAAVDCLPMPKTDDDVVLEWTMPLGENPWNGALGFWYRL